MTTHTTTPVCSHFPECGGCAYQNISYPEGQLDLKKKEPEAVFGRPLDLIASPVAFEYRNRMDFVCAFGKMGMRQKGKFNQVVDIQQCHLINPRVSEVLGKLRAILSEHAIKDFNFLDHAGYLRYIIFRIPTFTNDLMVNFVTFSSDPAIVPVMEKTLQYASSVNWLINDTLSETSVGRVHMSMGNPWFLEKINGRLFRAGPNTFFQNNIRVTEMVIDHIRPFISGTVADLCCGMGTLGLSLADRCEKVTGVEAEGESILYAQQNMELNNISNCSFVTQDLKTWFLQTAPSGFDTVIVDPPRTGLGGKLARKVMRLKAPTVVYVSCNPKTLADDLKWFEGYEVISLKALDMFPQTPHLETVAVLKLAQTQILNTATVV